MTSEIRANKQTNRVGLGTVEYTNTGIVVSGIVTCTELSGLTALNIAGVGTANTLDINGDIDVDGHTNLDNVSIAGITTFSSGMFIPDNQVIHLGNVAGTGDLQIYHDTSHSYVKDVGTGDLVLQTQGGHVMIKYGGDTMALFQPSNKAELYFANSPKLATTNTGITVTGQIAASTGVFSSAITASTYIQGTSSNGGLKFYSDSSASKGVVLNTDDHLVPSNDSNSDLGLTGTRWRNVYADTLYGDGSNLTSLPAQITFNNASADRILTSNGGTAVNAEANLTMNGNHLQFNTTANGHGVRIVSTGNYYNLLSFDSGNTSAGGELAYIDFKWDGDKVADIYAEAGSDTTNKDDGNLVFRTSPQQGNIANRLRISSTGQVRIYNELYLTDDVPLYLGSSNDLSLFHQSGGSSIIRYNHSVGGLHFRNNSNADQMIIDSSGRVIIGHTATDDRDGFNSSLQVTGTGGDDSSITLGRWSSNQSPPNLVFSKSRNGTIGSHTTLDGGDYLGQIQFLGDDGSNYHVGASIQARVENFSGGVGSDDMPTRLLINTNRDEANVATRMIIHGRGTDYNVLYGGRVDILGYEGQNITGGTNSNVLNEQFLVCPSAADGYADSHTITFGQTKGNWESGTGSSYDTSFGLMWYYAGQYNSTRELRAGIHYDHKAGEKFKIWSSYGDIIFKTVSANRGSKTAEECDQTPLRITQSNRVGINRVSVEETLDVDGGARFRSYVYIGDGFYFKSNAFGGNTNLDTGISINQGGRGGCSLLLVSRNYNAGTGTSAGIYRIKWYYDGNNAPATHHMSGDSFISFGVSGSNTLTINGGGGNQIYGIIHITG